MNRTKRAGRSGGGEGRALSRDWNIGLAEDRQDHSFAREFILAAVEEGIPLQIVLGKVARAIGAKGASQKRTR